MKINHLIAPCLVAIALAGCVSEAQHKELSETRYKEKQKHFAMPGVQADQVAMCSNYYADLPLAFRTQWVAATGIPLSILPMTMCRRLAQGVASGKISQEDYQAFSAGGYITPNTAKVLKGH
jgi:hypothetical protein